MMQPCTFHVTELLNTNFSYYIKIVIKTKGKLICNLQKEKQDFVVKTLNKMNPKLSPLSTVTELSFLYKTNDKLFFIIIINVWGHVCRYSRITRYQPLPQPEHSEMSQVKHVSTDRHTANVVWHSHLPSNPLDTGGPHLAHKLSDVLALTTENPLEKDRIDPQNTVGHLSKSIWQRCSLSLSELHSCAQLQSGVSNLVGPKYLESVNGWKGRILEVKTILFFKN